MFVTKVRRHGGSLVVGFAAALCRDLAIRSGDFMLLRVIEGKYIVLERIEPEKIIQIEANTWSTNTSKKSA